MACPGEQLRTFLACSLCCGLRSKDWAAFSGPRKRKPYFISKMTGNFKNFKNDRKINLARRVFLVSNLGGFRIFLAEKKPAIPREGDIRTTLSRGGAKSGDDLRVPGSI
jgi:hypothetical protein